MKRICIYLVEQAILGADLKEHRYFKTLGEASDFSNSVAYTSVPRKVYVSEKTADRLTETTRISLER